MKQDQYAHVRSVNWLDICPWLNILKSMQVAISFRVLLLGAVGLFLMLTGQILIEQMFGESPKNAGETYISQSATISPADATKKCPWTAPNRLIPQKPDAMAEASPLNTPPVISNWLELSDPLFGIFNEAPTVKKWASTILYGFWILFVWGFFGGAICRIAAVQLAVGERVGIVEALRFSCRKWLSFVGAPFMPLLGMAIVILVCGLIGILVLIPYVGPFLIALVFYPMLLVAGFVLSVLLLGLFFGWPLMWGTIATEGTDGFDALSRSYAYTFQRPLRYLFYVVVAMILGILSWLLISHFTAAVVFLTERAYLSIVGLFGTNVADISGMTTGTNIMSFWLTGAKWLACGFIFSYFWTAVCGIYLTLRRDVDAREIDEVYLEEPEEDLPVEEEEATETPAEDDATPPAEEEASGDAEVDEESDEPVVLEETPEDESADEEPKSE